MRRYGLYFCVYGDGMEANCDIVVLSEVCADEGDEL